MELLGGAAWDYRGCQEGCPEVVADCEELVVQDRHQDGQEMIAFCKTQIVCSRRSSTNVVQKVMLQLQPDGCYCATQSKTDSV